MMIILGLIFFIVTLCFIVVVHEGGHLIVAKRNGVYCHEFSIGMGPKIVQFYKDRSGTVYNLRAIPLGGYVSIAGEDTGVEADENIPDDEKFDSKSKWVRFKILVAGASMNFLLGIFIFALIGFFVGIPTVDNSGKITASEGGALYEAGIRTGDSIVEINGDKINSYNDVLEDFKSQETDFSVTYLHEDQEKTVDVSKDESGKVGVSQYVTYSKYRPINSIFYGLKTLIYVIASTFVSIYLLIAGIAPASDLMGPVGMATASTGIFSLGIVASLKWMAFLSLAIGVMNLLPIPALDGGRILFILIESVTGKPVNRKVETIMNNVVFFALIALMMYVTIFDILRIDDAKNLFNSLK